MRISVSNQIQESETQRGGATARNVVVTKVSVTSADEKRVP